MSCTTLTVFDISMATTQLTCADCYEPVWPLYEPQSSKRRHPIMNWAVVTDNHGIKQLRLQWRMGGSDS